jgi:hypothetical protein
VSEMAKDYLHEESRVKKYEDEVISILDSIS